MSSGPIRLPEATEPPILDERRAALHLGFSQVRAPGLAVEENAQEKGSHSAATPFMP